MSMRTLIKTKIAEADARVSDFARPEYDVEQVCLELRMTIHEVVTAATEYGQYQVHDICQSVRRGPISYHLARSTLVKCLAAIPPERPTPLMTVDEVAEMLNVSVRSVHRLRSKGEIPEAVELGKSIRWRQSDIEKITKG